MRKQLGAIEKSVTHLLVATKQLLETLTAWSRQQATEAEVSDVYVRLGSEFNVACRAFSAIGVETADLGNVPDALRTILENTLSQDASPQSLDVYLPRIREIIINLLHGLKRKQHKLRQKQLNKELSDRDSGSSRDRGSSGTQRTDSIGSNSDDVAAPPRKSSLPRQSDTPPTSTSSLRDSRGSRASRNTNGSSNGFSAEQSTFDNSAAYPTIEEHSASPVIPAPPPIPQTQDALAALQQHSLLQRRASKRYSAYQIAKMTGDRPDAFPMMPSTRDPSAIPRNRESMDAVRKRATHSRSGSATAPSGSKGSLSRKPNRISEEPEYPLHTPVTPAEKLGPAHEEALPQPSLKIDTDLPVPTTALQEEVMTNGVIPSTSTAVEAPGDTVSETGKDLTIFLQIGRSIKKVYLPDGESELSMPALRLLFMNKFSYNPPAGDDFPEIYLQDPVSGVRYELEDLRDVKDRSVLCLNVEVLDEVKRHIDDGMDNLKKLVQGIAGSVESQGQQISRVAERQEEAARKIAAIAASPPAPTPTPSSRTSATPLAAADKERQLAEIRDIRKDLAVIRQVYSAFESDVKTSMATIKTKAQSVKTIVTVGPNEGRAYVEKSKASLESLTEATLTRVDDLQDTVEDLRKDVVSRGVRPLPRQLETISKEMSLARMELQKMKDSIAREKPLFRRIWEHELEVVCKEQEFLNVQEGLVGDLENDLDMTAQTFALVEQCSQQQMKVPNSGARNPSRGFMPLDVDVDPADAKDSVLSEVRALQPNHENRLEAIERAEKARQKELEGRVPEFQKELGKFVEEGKLKKTGGAEEVERQRAVREAQALKEAWEFKLQMEAKAAESSSEEEEETDEEDDEDDATAPNSAPA